MRMKRLNLDMVGRTWEYALPCATKAVLQAYCWHCNDQGVCWPSVARIAQYTGLNARTVQRRTRELETAGALVCIPHAKTSSKTYRINLDALEQSQRLTSQLQPDLPGMEEPDAPELGGWPQLCGDLPPPAAFDAVATARLARPGGHSHPSAAGLACVGLCRALRLGQPLHPGQPSQHGRCSATPRATGPTGKRPHQPRPARPGHATRPSPATSGRSPGHQRADRTRTRHPAALCQAEPAQGTRPGHCRHAGQPAGRRRTRRAQPARRAGAVPGTPLGHLQGAEWLSNPATQPTTMANTHPPGGWTVPGGVNSPHASPNTLTA